MGRVHRAGGTAAVVLVSVALAIAAVQLGRVAWAGVSNFGGWYLEEARRRCVTPPWEYAKTYGRLPPGADPRTYGKTTGQGRLW